MDAKELQAAFVAKLKSSGLTQQQARQLGYRTYLKETAQAKFPNLSARRLRAGFLLPYFDLRGRQNGFYRYRNLDQEPRGFEQTAPPKYLQEPRSCADIYLPPLPSSLPAWKKIADDVTVRLIITEGELKAACAAIKFGQAAFAIPGVSYFQSKREGLRLLKGFQLFQWEQREVYVIFDSDCVSNPQVHDARQTLCARLVDCGARVFLVDLPALPGLAKTGLDDYLLSPEGGKDQLKQLMEATEEAKASTELWHMNDTAIYVREVSQIYIPEENLFLKPTDFVNNYKTWNYVVTLGAGKNTKMGLKIVPTEWMPWPHRRECARVTFEPTEPPLAINSSDAFNMFKGLKLEPRRGDVHLWHDLMAYVFEGQRAELDWFTSWAAYPLQAIAGGEKPKMHSCVAFISPTQGSAKTTVGETLGKLYGRYHKSIGSRELRAEHNDWNQNLLFIVGNEVTDQKSSDVADYLKGLITEPKFWLRPLYVKRIEQPNHFNFFFTSNHPDAFFLSFSDRRFFVHAAPQVKWLDAPGWGPKKLDEYFVWSDSEQGQASLLDYLLHWRIPSSWDHRQPPDTSAKLAMQSASANQVENWLRGIADCPELLGNGLEKRRLWTAAELLAVFQGKTGDKKYSDKAMGQALLRANWYRVLRKKADQIRYLNLGTKEKPIIGKKPLWTPPYFAGEVKKLTTERSVAEQFNREREAVDMALRYGRIAV